MLFSPQAYFIIPVAVFAILSSIFLVILPILQKPIPTLLALGTTLLGIPAYLLFMMETPYRLRPKILDRISSKLNHSAIWLTQLIKKSYVFGRTKLTRGLVNVTRLSHVGIVDD